MSNHLHSQHHYNLCERDSDGILWCISNNLTREQVKEQLKEDLSMYHEIVVVMVETNSFDVSEEFKWEVFDDNNGNKGE